MKKSSKNIILFFIAFSVGLSVLAAYHPEASAQWWWSQSGDKELAKIQNRNQQISKLLEKGRAEREKHNYKGARRYGESALRLDETNEAARAFLDYLPIEEKQWTEYQAFLKEERLKEKEAKKSERQRKKEERIRAKQEAKKLKAEEAAKKRAAKLPVKKPVRKEEEEAVVEEEVDERIYEVAEPGEKKPVKPKDVTEEVEWEEEAEPADLEGDLAGLAQPGQPIIVDGDKVEYFEEKGIIVAEGNVSITYGDVKLTCDRIEVNTKQRAAFCEGNVRIEHPEGVLEGDRIRYDFNLKEGEIIGGEVTAYPWFGSAEESAKVGPNEYVLKGGYITTCDLDGPHYHIKAGEIRVFPDEKVIAKNAVFYIGSVPVLWVPYYYHPIIQSRAKVQFIPGVTSEWGYFLLSAWRAYVQGNSRVDGLLDYRTKKGFAGGANFYYNLVDFGMDGLGYGLLRAYFINQYGLGTYDGTSFRGEDPNKEEWRNRLQWKHRVDFDPTTVGMLEFNKLSDEYVLEDYFYNEYEETNPVPQNYFSIISAQPNYTFTVAGNWRLDEFYTVVQRLPELKIEVFNQRLWDTPLYYTQETSVTNFQKRYAWSEHAKEDVGRFDTFHQFSYVTGLGPVNIVPFGNIRGTAYTRTIQEKKPVMRGVFGGGVDVFMRFHRVFDITTDALGLDINKVRHIIVPKATFDYRLQPTIDRNELYAMDDVDTIDKESVIKMQLENKLQTKKGKGKKLHNVDLVRHILSVDYEFRLKKNKIALNNGGRFINLKSDLELRPYDWFYVDNELEFDTKRSVIEKATIEGTMRPWKNFHVALGYRYTYDEGDVDPHNQLTFDLNWKINSKWDIGVYERFDLEDNEIAEQQFSITRDLHCWEVEFSYDVDGGNFMKDDFTMWLAFRIKAFPDLPIGLARSFTKRPPGSMSQSSQSY